MIHALLSIDPDTKRSGLAYFVEGVLKLIQAHNRFVIEGSPEQYNEVWIEKPRVYRAARSKGDPNDLLDVACISGRWFQACQPNASYIYPADWKGQLTKPQSHARIWRELLPEERELFVDGRTYRSQLEIESYIMQGIKGGAYSSQISEPLDAAGIGLYILGRVKK